MREASLLLMVIYINQLLSSSTFSSFLLRGQCRLWLSLSDYAVAV